MIDVTGVPAWAWAAGAASTLMLLIAFAFATWLTWRRTVRRHLVKVVGRREGVVASRRTLEAIVRHLADEDDSRLTFFAEHPESEDRRALAETASRMAIAAEELDTMPLPQPLWPAAEALADVAFVVGEEAGRVGESDDVGTVFAGLELTDLDRVERVFEVADARVREACERYDLDEASVYGGGLYI